MKIIENSTRQEAKTRRKNKTRDDETKIALRRVTNRSRTFNSIEKLYKKSLNLTSSSLSEAHETKRNKTKAKIKKRDENNELFFKD